MAAQIKTTSKLLQEREAQSMQAARQVSDSLHRVIREQENKLDTQAKLLTELD